MSEDIYITRYYKFNCDSLVNSFNNSYNSSYQRLDLNWTPMLGADEYDVEYNFYDSASSFILGYVGSSTYTDYGFLFNGNATRVTVSGTFVDLSLVYNHGWIFTRIRPVNYDSLGNRITGRWTTDIRTSTTESAFFGAYGYNWAGHMPAFNWQYTAAYAEEGKRKEVSSYFDGTLRNRQSVTMNNTENKAIVGETMYDHQGRAALTTLPGPIDTGKLYFYNLYNVVSAGVEYSRHDFDTGSCGFIPPPMDSVTTGSVERGSSGYYSSSNPDKSVGFNAYLPDAQGYPFTQTEYTLDNTGRIARQSIADKTHTLGSGHETKYFYGKPAQEEIDRLFGSEVGDNSHYLENMVMDANGQISVSYVDANGKTIATALSGQPPSNTQALPSYYAATSLYINLLDEGANQLNPTTLNSSYGLLATNSGRYYFNYKLYPGNYTDNTCASNVCTDCLYDVVLMVTDNCGGDSPLIIHHDTNFTYASTYPFDTLCGHTNIVDTFSVYLTPGEYNISRQISIDPGAMNFYEAYNLRHNTCLKTYSNFLATAIANTDFGGCGENCTQCLAALGTSSAFLTKYINELIAAGEATPTHADTASADTAYNQAKANCNLLCATPSLCSDLYNEMMTDVSLGGQYCNYTVVGGKDTSTDPASVITTGAYKTPCSPYLNSGGVKDSVIIAGVKYAPTQLSENEFIQNWKPSWANSLVCKHPEYCYYNYCQLDTASNRFDAAMEDSSTYLGAWNAGFINPIGDSSYPGHGIGNYYNINWKDPYFRGGQGSALLHNMFQRMRHYLIIDSSGTNVSLSMWEVAALEAYCSEDTLSAINLSHCFPSPGFTSGCAGDLNMNWELFRGLYMSLKQKVQDSLEAIYVVANGCTYATCIGQSGCGPGSEYASKIPRVVSETYAANQSFMPGGTPSKASSLSWFNSHVTSDCDSMCRAEAYSWYNALVGCGSILHTDSATLVSALIQVCDSGCNTTHPFGASTMPHNRADANGDHSFEDVIHRVLGTARNNVACDSLNITMPPPYADSNGITGPQVTYYKPDTCVCNKLTYYFDTYYQPDSLSGDTHYKNFADYLSKNLGGNLTESQVYMLMSSCSGSCFYLPTPLQLPNWLNCCGNDTFHITALDLQVDTTAHFTITHCCINCSDIEGAMRMFYFQAGYCDTIPNYQSLVANYLNQTFNFDLTYEQYMAFYKECKDTTIITNPTLPSCFNCSDCTEKLVPSLALTLCNEPLLTVPAAVDSNPCYTYLMMDAQYNAQNAYNNYIDSVNTNFTANYIKHCMNIQDSFHLNMPFDEYHYTLYYYDQAENLVKTIPPQGVHPITAISSLDSVKAYRAGTAGYNPVYPIDSMQTRYWYNTLNSPALQITPDGDSVRYWYDRLGREALSQNAIQKPYLYSYTKYDALNRVIEVGQLSTGSTKIAPGTFVRTDATLQNFIRHWHHTQVTHSFYDTAEYTSLPIAQQNLRKRISSITFEDVDDSNVNTYDNAIHYSYDIDGNVATILNENRHNTIVKQQYKRLDYYYDLISSKVNECIYQHDSLDQFMQIYEYDADNRITNVITSRDSIYFENDDDYEYYDHGPLAREVIGQRQVQGIDYAYTLNGWLKGKNSSILNPSYDMGEDGNVHGTTRTIGRDAMGFTLGYYNGDYRAIGGSQFEALGLPDTSSYTGNIVGATYSIKPLIPKTIGYKYSYDQLNRLTDLVAFTAIDTINDKWSSPSPVKDFQEKVAYDENGNIFKYIRHGNTIGTGTPLAMDSLNYYYPKGKNQLNYVTDGVPSTNYPNDIHNETSKYNYKYNGIGELAHDSAGALDTITWTLYGKIKKIKKHNGDSLVFEYDGLDNRIEKRFYPHSATADTTLYALDGQGNILATYDRRKDTVRLNEWDMYGSKRIGTVDTLMRLFPKPANTMGGSLDSGRIAYQEGQKQYELDNHLSNVLVTVSDKKIPVDTTGTPNIANYYVPVVVTSQDYYPFGMLEPGRSYLLSPDSSYRFAFNDKLKTDEIYGDGNAYDYGMRMYDPRLGRFLSIDPLEKKFAYYSPYMFAGNKPIIAVDVDGLEEYIVVNEHDVNNQISKTTITSITNADGQIVMDNKLHPANVQNTKYLIINNSANGSKSSRFVNNPTPDEQDAIDKTQSQGE
ncbi:MAG TPA: RHS repeat-associated core domain-containing protein, partial [Bacteroidia bacterium]|nr:RHS repeat-associated core domain-containing protein [Bacteroidia bacterium]